jgi:AraC-like DNA-binding protein
MRDGGKGMIANCVERMRQGACATCERREACAFPWLHMGDRETPFPRRAGRGEARSASSARNPFLAFLGEVAKAIEKRAKPKRSPLQRDVERRVEPLLETGEVRIDRIARELGLSRQTLYRRLKAEGVTFEALVDGLRRRLALRFVREQGLPVKEAAWRLGFSDPAAFSRAFKRWTGSSPSAMQR